MKKATIWIFIILFGINMFPKENNLKKFQIELFGGISSMDPKDLNSRAFAYSEYYRMNYNENEKLKTITHMFPTGVRLKYHLSNNISFSLGFQYSGDTRESDLSLIIGSTNENNYVKLSASALSPVVGVHYRYLLSKTLTLEFFVSAGISFGSCSYTSRIEIRDKNTGNLDWFQYSGAEGTGTGYLAEGGFRVNLDIFKNLSLFLETGYALQRLSGFYGPGFLERPGESDSWEGEWGTKMWEISSSYRVEIASNFWEDGDFRLDISGFRIRIGCGFRF